VGLRRVVAALFAGVACAQAVGSRAAEPAPPLELSAESLEYERGRDLFIASGSVVVRRGESRLNADWVAFSPSTGRGVASGEVVVTDGRDTLRTRFVEFDVDDMQGVLFDASFDVPSGHMRMQGAMIAKTGDQTYSFEKGVFTSCRCPDPEMEDPWRIRAESAELEVGGYGTARDTTFEILGVPVAWLPWAIYPLKTERQSGLLLPEVELSGRNGFEVGVPIFFAAGDPVNVVATPRWLSKRGAKGDLEVEYVAGERSGGRAFGSYIRDGEIDPNSLTEPFGRNRWSTLGSHDWFGPLGTRLKADYLFASDNAFPDDFDELRPWRTARTLPAVASAEGRAGASGRFGMVAGAEYFDDRQAPDDTDRDDFVLQRLPEVGVHALPGPVGPLAWLVPALDVEYVRFHQSERPQHRYSDSRLVTSDGRFFDSGIDGIADSREQGRDGLGSQGGARPDPNADDFDALTRPKGREGDGRFQEGELLAEGGQRLLLTPRIAVPWRIADAVELYPEVGWHQTLYDGDAGGFASQGLLTGRVDLRTQLRRRFGASLTHLLEPRIGWAGIQRTKDRDDTPLFVPATRLPQNRLRELQLDNVTLDPADRIESANALNFGFANRFFGSPFDDGGARLLGDVTLLGQYDFAHSRWGRIVVDGSALPLESLSTRFWAAFDPQQGQLDEGSVSVAWRHEDGHAVRAGYSYLREFPELFGAYPRQNDRFDSYRELGQLSQANLGVRVAFLERWAVTWAGAYSFASSFLIGNKGGVEYFSACGCWAARLELAQDRSSGVAVRLVYRLVGIGDDAENPFAPHGQGPGFGSLDAF
jgi:lipopolysaccharide assembly outer membrane protein LptD (OstA)